MDTPEPILLISRSIYWWWWKGKAAKNYYFGAVKAKGPVSFCLVFLLVIGPFVIETGSSLSLENCTCWTFH
jgi:hypothetical protein